MKLYTASKTKHADKWKALREKGYNVISTWIDEAGEGQTSCFADLATRCINEPAHADVTLLYCEEGEILKFALLEVGAALAHNKQVIVVGSCPSISNVILKHPNVTFVNSLEFALTFLTPKTN